MIFGLLVSGELEPWANTSKDEEEDDKNEGEEEKGEEKQDKSDEEKKDDEKATEENKEESKQDQKTGETPPQWFADLSYNARPNVILVTRNKNLWPLEEYVRVQQKKSITQQQSKINW